MGKKKVEKGRYNFLLDKEVYEDFSLICEELGLVRSKKIEISLRSFVEENKELLKKIKKK
ncbi:MAG: hypothetical protein KKH52_01130 [Nanoarchaeota archaeon]|nr:hypothetical protein [Nanoarchaeota archaeon]MBU1622284.1 hypothetical protein [Nanoarchaeota archaeon]MBU1973979.1 hypothetical protein [Nanoarchaeota archaeon]